MLADLATLFHCMSEEMQKLWVSRAPTGRPGRAEEAAAMIAWLASEDCSFTTGAAFDRGVAAR